MVKVFSRWPSQISPHTIAGPDELVDRVPLWMSASSRRPWLNATLKFPSLILFAVLFAGLGITAFSFAAPAGIATFVAVAAVFGFAILAAYALWLRHSLADSKLRYATVFERAGISMWREDWSAAAQVIAALRKTGVTDMEGYFATRPEELRALCARVMILDVNAFTVEEAGASGKASFIGPLDRLLPHTDQTFVQWLVAFAQGERFFRSEAHIMLPDGSVRDTLFTAALPHDLAGFSNIIVTSLDITGYKSEQNKLHAADAEIARASRISTVGALSASIAHEVNSPLAAVLANAQAALRWLQRPVPSVGDATEAVSAIVADATRAKNVVARTRAFVGKSPLLVEPFDLVAAAREAILLVERDLRDLGAAVHLRTEAGILQAEGDVIQIQQVITNLLLNAAQAMTGQAGAKEVTVTLALQGESIRVDMADTGPGIDPSQLERVFDPFYTTKTDGMGMGLAICRNCLDAQGGNIWATSDRNAGATIHFTLPVHRG